MLGLSVRSATTALSATARAASARSRGAAAAAAARCSCSTRCASAELLEPVDSAARFATSLSVPLVSMLLGAFSPVALRAAIAAAPASRVVSILSGRPSGRPLGGVLAGAFVPGAELGALGLLVLSFAIVGPSKQK
jgi:hypothetical protein